MRGWQTKCGLARRVAGLSGDKKRGAGFVPVAHYALQHACPCTLHAPCVHLAPCTLLSHLQLGAKPLLYVWLDLELCHLPPPIDIGCRSCEPSHACTYHSQLMYSVDLCRCATAHPGPLCECALLRTRCHCATVLQNNRPAIYPPCAPASCVPRCTAAHLRRPLPEQLSLSESGSIPTRRRPPRIILSRRDRSGSVAV